MAGGKKALAEYEDAAAGTLAVKGFVVPERGVHFELQPGQPLADEVTRLDVVKKA